jgi:hypothetical protein
VDDDCVHHQQRGATMFGDAAATNVLQFYRAVAL